MRETTISNQPAGQDDVISVREILSILGEQKVFIILFCMSAILTALALTYIASEKYESAITISYRPQEVTRFKAQESEAFGAPSPAPPFELISKNLNELVHSENLLRKVVLELKLYEDIEAPPSDIWYIQWYREVKSFALDLANDTWMYLKHGRLIEEDPVFAATKALRKNTNFVDRSSYIFYIVVRDKYPWRAPMIVDSIAAHLIDYLHNQQKTPGQAKKLQLKELLDEKKLEIQQTKDDISELLAENTIVSSSIEVEQGLSRWSRLELERVELEGEIKNLEARLADTEKYYDQRFNKGSRSGSGDEKDFLIQPEDYKKLSSERLFTTIELNGLRAKLNSVVRELETLDTSLRDFPDIEIRLNSLQTQLDILQREFIQVSDAYQEALLASTASLAEAEILHAATSPKVPVAPVKIYNVGLAAMLSLFVSIALVYLLDYAEIHLLFSPRRRGKQKQLELKRKALPHPEDRRQATVDRRAEGAPERRQGGDRRKSD